MICRLALLALTLLAAVAAGLGGAVRAEAMIAKALPGFEIVICAEDGARTIRVDASGSPVEPENEHCPCPCLDCLQTADTAALPAPAHHASAAAARSLHAVATADLFQPPARRMRPEARGPPTEATA